ncbi:MAG: DNA repair protein RecO [Thermoleophilia bacterium]|nr:DNA repair protein RecO [Thermoleophilia bacterium]
MGRTVKTEAVVLRSLRLGEADRVLHLYTPDRGRIGAVAKGIRRTKSRFGARLEPLSHVELLLHQGTGELGTITGVDLLDSHRGAREDAYRLGVALVGAEAVLRLFGEGEGNPRVFAALARFLEVADDLPSRVPERPAVDPLALAFQLKLLWLAGYLPHLESCVECGGEGPLVGFAARTGGAVCRACAAGSLALAPATLRGMEQLLRRPLVEAADASGDVRAGRETLAVLTALYEFHGGFRLRTLAGS